MTGNTFTASTEVPVRPVAIEPSNDYSAAITAWATVALVLATGVLAYLTWVLARATSRASIVVTIEPNPAAINFLDIHVFNEGNVAAYNINITFEPPLPESGGQFERISYPKDISIFSAGQRLVSSLCEAFVIMDLSYQINISWASRPNARRRQSVSYAFDLSHLKAMSTLGKDPTVQSADEIKKIRELLDKMASGRSRVKIDTFTQHDRERERERAIADRASYSAAEQHPAGTDASYGLSEWIKPAGSVIKWVKAKLS